MGFNNGSTSIKTILNETSYLKYRKVEIELGMWAKLEAPEIIKQLVQNLCMTEYWKCSRQSEQASLDSSQSQRQKGYFVEPSFMKERDEDDQNLKTYWIQGEINHSNLLSFNNDRAYTITLPRILNKQNQYIISTHSP